MTHFGRPDPILPGSTLGILGSGQLGRMLAQEAKAMGYRVWVLSPGSDTPTGQLADREIDADYLDLDAVKSLAFGVDVVTFEFENVPAAAAEAAAEITRVRPAHRVLSVAQNRRREKEFLASKGFPVAPFEVIRGPEALEEALGRLGTPAVLKTAAFGYDGKGQEVIGAPEEALDAWARLDVEEAVLEAFIDFEGEVSVVGARGEDGSFDHWGVMGNDHADHILDVTVCPAPLPPALAREAVELAREILEALGVVGVLCVEMFVTREGRLLVNELAPRPHNSGHLTLEAHVTSQFEQQLRAVCGLPLGSTRRLAPGAAMANLLGDLWFDDAVNGSEVRGRGQEPDQAPRPPHWEALLAHPEVKLHLYGKHEPRRGRKMGHLTALGRTPEEAAERVRAAREALAPSFG